MRKLVTVRKISEINDIKGADRIKVAVVDGWEVVVKANEFVQGSYCVFFEIDSFIPVEDTRFEFMHSSSLRSYEGKKGVRVKTIKLRGQVSQGLALPVSAFPEIEDAISGLTEEEVLDSSFDELLGVVKYDTFTARRGSTGGPKIIPAHAAGAFPWYIPKTDEERIENLWQKRERLCDGDISKQFYYTLKVDGSSTTVFLADERLGYYDGIDIDENGFQAVVCSRNLALKYDADATFWKAVESSGVIAAIKAIKKATGRTLAIQGETLAPCIQGGREKFEEPTFLAFCAYDIDEHKYLSYNEFIKIMDYWDIPRVPVLKGGSPFTEFSTINEMKDFVDTIKENFGDDVFADVPEGIVFHPVSEAGNSSRKSFKCISRKYLLATGE